MQLRGNWDDAERDAQNACELLMSDGRQAGAAFYRLGEIHRLRGEFAKAEASYARANERGRKPQPGLALLRLEQDQTDAAAASIRGALLDTRVRAPRARILVAAVEILLAAGDLDNARAAAEELSQIATASARRFFSRRPRTPPVESSLPKATSRARRHRCVGRAKSGGIWRCPTKRRRPACCWRLSVNGAVIRTATVSSSIPRDGCSRSSAPNPASRASPSHRSTPRASAVGSLSEREVQVLRLIAAGKTNRAIADELFISDKTVARHVSNIFDKLACRAAPARPPGPSSTTSSEAYVRNTQFPAPAILGIPSDVERAPASGNSTT